jgi:hypothetical protein
MLASWPTEEFLSWSGADIAERILQAANADEHGPTLARNAAYLLQPREIREGSRRRDGIQATSPLTQITLAVPVSGPYAHFNLIPSDRPTPAIRGQVDEQEGILHLHWMGEDKDSAKIKHYFERQLDMALEVLREIKTEIETGNRWLANEIPAAVALRRDKLLSDRKAHANIGYPIRPRADASTWRVPLRRQTISPRSPREPVNWTRFQSPEPALADADYEEVLSVLRNARNALERSPSMNAKLGENEIRDLLLVMLNAQFEGRASGEVFNGYGRTDILIREDDRNVFIGECKIFDRRRDKQSEKHVVTGALDQLLHYLVWRDTKAAILLFVRDPDVSSVVAKGVAAIESHPNYARPGRVRNEDRYDFVLRANGDASREIFLAFLPFAMGCELSTRKRTKRISPIADGPATVRNGNRRSRRLLDQSPG